MRDRGSGTVTKALGVVDQFLEGGPSLTLTQLSARSGIHKSTLLRLLASLQQAGLVERNAAMAYQLGPKVWRLAQAYRRQFSLEHVVRPRLCVLRDRTGESASFYVRDGNRRVCLYRESSAHPIRHHVEEGARLPLTRGVVGRVLLAYSGARAADYARIRARGHLVDQGREPYTASVAVPVLTTDGGLAGALVVSGLASRFGKRRQVEALRLLRDAARAIGEAFPNL